MTERTYLAGQYRIVNHDLLHKKAERLLDPRHAFYVAMLSSRTYEGYLAAVGETEVSVPSYRSGPISGRMEILYSRRSGWIADAR